MHKLVIIQPWFLAKGHPAQSLLNTAQSIGVSDNVMYCVPRATFSSTFSLILEKVKKIGKVVEYDVKTDSLRESTVKALFSLNKLLRVDSNIDRLFFLDAHLILLAILWPLFYQEKIKFLGVIYLAGPEKIVSSSFKKALIKRFLKRNEVFLFLRTEELADDWTENFPASGIKTLPSLEMPESEHSFQYNTTFHKHELQFGIIGQIRTGKSIDWLVPLFKSNPQIGRLTVAGAWANENEHEKLSFLDSYDCFQEGFLTEEAMLELVSQQDYILMLYDQWDPRMESAMMFVAARVNKPVIVYDRGWAGRMVKTHGNGLAVPMENFDFNQFFNQLPKRQSPRYEKLIYGVKKFREAHNTQTQRKVFIDAMFK